MTLILFFTITRKS